jgi:hypothetical protein
MFGLGRQGRGRTRDARVPGARSKSAGALTAAAGAVRDTAIESAREGITKVGEKVGQVAGAGMAVAATAAVGATGYHASPWVAAGVATGAAYAGAKVGGLVSRAMNAGMDRIAAGRSGSPIGSVMAELSGVLQTLDQLGRGVAEVIDSVNHAQAHFQKVSKGAGSNLLNGAVRSCRQAPVRLEEGVDEIKQAQDLVGMHLVTVATTGG